MEYKKWKDLGNNIKKARGILIVEMVAMVDKDNQTALTKKVIAKLQKAINELDKFKDSAEERMFADLKGSGISLKQLMDVFYGKIIY